MDNQTPNRLIKEKSPYLLQHAYNPVDWYPWGSEAFERAKLVRISVSAPPTTL
ncbi:MAG: thymidylate kinase [Deltaproteobacteria bacterium]|nr:MAG: thymidylate kinase [Desulfobacteraceae bacterium 4484_190.3]RLB19811.1 MAG: thymidylate kinase [Deltaproteobacteria bacterium]